MPESPTADSSATQQAYPPPPGTSQPAYPPPRAAAPPATPDNLADFFNAPAVASPSSSFSAAAQSSTAHIDDMFSAAPKPKAPAPRPQAAASPAASSSGAGSRQGQGAAGSSAGASRGVRPPPQKPAPKAAPTSMIDFGDEAALLAEDPDLYKGLEEVAGNHSIQLLQHTMMVSEWNRLPVDNNVTAWQREKTCLASLFSPGSLVQLASRRNLMQSYCCMRTFSLLATSVMRSIAWQAV